MEFLNIFKTQAEILQFEGQNRQNMRICFDFEQQEMLLTLTTLLVVTGAAVRALLGWPTGRQNIKLVYIVVKST